MTEKIITFIRGLRRSIKNFTYSSFLSLLVIAIILLILFKMDQAYTMMVYMLEEDKFSLFLCFIYVNALALTLSHYPIYTYYSKGFNNSKGVVTWEVKKETHTFFKKYKLSYPYFIYTVDKKSNYKMSVAANVLRYTLGIFIYAVWVIFIYKSVRPNLLFNDHLGVSLQAIAWIIGIFFSFPIIIYAVLKYRIPNPKSSNEPHLVPLSDARKALKMMHQKADVYGIHTNEIGVVGFSAGSHLATVLALWKSDEQMENPDFTGLIYGVTDLNEGNKGWLESNLYHRKMTEEEVIQNTLLNLINKDTPQAFLAHAVDDDSCRLEETTLYAQKLLAQGVLVETHIFPKGGHGFGVGAASDGTDQWVGLFVNWLKHSTF